MALGQCRDLGRQRRPARRHQRRNVDRHDEKLSDAASMRWSGLAARSPVPVHGQRPGGFCELGYRSTRHRASIALAICTPRRPGVGVEVYWSTAHGIFPPLPPPSPLHSATGELRDLPSGHITYRHLVLQSGAAREGRGTHHRRNTAGHCRKRQLKLGAHALSPRTRQRTQGQQDGRHRGEWTAAARPLHLFLLSFPAAGGSGRKWGASRHGADSSAVQCAMQRAAQRSGHWSV